MKILLSSDSYKEQMNGAAGIVRLLAEELQKLGHDARVLTMSDSRWASKKPGEYYLPSFKTPLYPGVRQTLARRHPYIKELIAWHPDLIHIHSEGSAARISRRIGRACHAPILMTSHTDYMKYAFHNHSDSRFCQRLGGVLYPVFYRGSDMLIAPSEKGSGVLQRYHCQGPITVVPNGIRRERFSRDFPAAERAAFFQRYGIPDNGKTFVCISRLSKEKNLQEILRFFRDLADLDEDVRLLITGDGPFRPELEHLSEELGLGDRVIFTGRADQEDLYRYYKAGTAFLSASTFEMHSLSYLEAMASGLPLICRKDPCLEGVLEDGKNGFIYSDEKEFIRACMRIISEPELRERLAAESARRSEYFTAGRFAQRTLELYEQVICAAAENPPEDSDLPVR